MTANRNRRRPIIRPVFHHTTFATLKLDEMVEFYEAIAGLEPVYHGTEGAWLSNDEANHRIALLALPDLKPSVDKGHTVGLHHTAFEYGTFDVWLDNYERLAERGIRPFVCLDHGMTMSMYYQDPEGNGVEIQFDTFGSWNRSKEWMWESEEFSLNPVGKFFDPEQIVAARKAGQGGEEIHRRARNDGFLPAVIPDVHLPDLW
ncbi:VOC family protein [Subtercola boreus]|uniref:Extradiol dioxygenase n=1 Tax=Subtercola boreus TaxID=120213 RepID=A0A3E0WF63_9MICO|nr:VOC family protein [Subtercola boreus]RFA22733.1 extradiol dioxygenase [Subtercola boreus]RFA23088.1 extradiol dioxygenase [Subtercola boreus]RFA28841.1 extradiol dioxygenase [Subtercola boreus]